MIALRQAMKNLNFISWVESVRAKAELAKTKATKAAQKPTAKGKKK